MSTTERRDRQREALVDAAEAAIAMHGAAGLKARDLAREVGCAVGAIYNLVADIDELVLRVGSRTLARLDEALATSAHQVAPVSADDATECLVALARGYCAFARDNLNLWRMLFEHRMAEDAELPDWSAADQMVLFRHIAKPLERLTPGMGEEERGVLARTLFSAVHGVIAIGLEDKLVAVPRRRLDEQIETLVRLISAGLAAGQKRSA